VEMKHCQRRIATLWFGVAGVIALIMIFQTLLGHYADPGAAWAWLVPNLVPTLSLIIGVLVAESLSDAKQRMADAFLYRVCLGVSAFYLLSILMILLLQPFSSGPAAELMKQGQQFWIGPVQGLATASLGAFFVRAGPAATGAPAES